MTPEAAFVSGLARGDFDTVADAMGKPLDEHRVSQLMTDHQIGPLCYWVHTNSSSSRVPDALLAQARHEYLHHTVRNEHLANTIADINMALSERGVLHLYLKGPWLAFNAYPEPGTRPIGDIDLCVQPDDYRRAVATLIDVGYEPIDDVPIDPQDALRRAHLSRQLRFASRGRPQVEMHFHLINVGPVVSDERWVYDSAISVDVGPTTIRVPGPEAMVVHLLLHANQHGFAVLRLLHDIRWAIAYYRDLDWQIVDRHVRRLRCTAATYHALLLARDVASAPAPDAVLKSWQPPLARRTLYSLAWKLAQVRRMEAARRRTETESPVFYLLEMGTWSDKWRYLKGIVQAAGDPRELMATVRRARAQERLDSGRSGE
jgi:hypothetical protein